MHILSSLVFVLEIYRYFICYLRVYPLRLVTIKLKGKDYVIANNLVLYVTTI